MGCRDSGQDKALSWICRALSWGMGDWWKATAENYFSCVTKGTIRQQSPRLLMRPRPHGRVESQRTSWLASRSRNWPGGGGFRCRCDSRTNSTIYDGATDAALSVDLSGLVLMERAAHAAPGTAEHLVLIIVAATGWIRWASMRTWHARAHRSPRKRGVPDRRGGIYAENLNRACAGVTCEVPVRSASAHAVRPAPKTPCSARLDSYSAPPQPSRSRWPCPA